MPAHQDGATHYQDHRAEQDREPIGCLRSSRLDGLRFHLQPRTGLRRRLSGRRLVGYGIRRGFDAHNILSTARKAGSRPA